MSLRYTKAESVRLKTHPEFNEKWLQEKITKDPSILGLGDLDVRDVERSQPSGGRLDLLLRDPETSKRYEVEIQLGTGLHAKRRRTQSVQRGNGETSPLSDSGPGL